jgi:hypothetical protein
VPALVTERLLPCWRSSASGQDAENTPAAIAQKKLEAACEEMRAKTVKSSKHARKYEKSSKRRQYSQHESAVKMNCVVPTLSTAMKKSERIIPSELGWSVLSVSEGKDLLHPHIAALENGGAGPAWDELREQKLKEFRESKSLWLTHDVKPGGRTPSAASKEVEEVRSAGKSRLKTLSAQYEKKRQDFQESQKINNSRLGSFQQFIDEKKLQAKAKAEEAARIAAIAKKEAAKANELAGVLSLGLTKNRPTTAAETEDSKVY